MKQLRKGRPTGNFKFQIPCPVRQTKNLLMSAPLAFDIYSVAPFIFFHLSSKARGTLVVAPGNETFPFPQYTRRTLLTQDSIPKTRAP